MKVYIIGVSGMLGSCLFFNFTNNNSFNVRGSMRGSKNYYYPKFHKEVDLNIDVLDFNILKKKILNFNPDYVINCVGWIKQKKNEDKNASYLNSIFPHKLNKFLEKKKIKLIHFSTDCVFNGKKGNYKLTEKPNAQDLYGKSKKKGEVLSKNCLTIRTSIIGNELKKPNGLLEWFLAKKYFCQGYCNVFFTGLTTYEVYKFLLTVLKSKKKINGLYHLSSNKISKYNLLTKIKKIYKKNIDIRKNYSIKIDRSLSNKISLRKFQFIVSSWSKMINEMKNNRELMNKNIKIN